MKTMCVTADGQQATYNRQSQRWNGGEGGLSGVVIVAKGNKLDTLSKDIQWWCRGASQENVLLSIANLHGAFFILRQSWMGKVLDWWKVARYKGLSMLQMSCLLDRRNFDSWGKQENNRAYNRVNALEMRLLEGFSC